MKGHLRSWELIEMLGILMQIYAACLIAAVAFSSC